ncbi:hypothetical protein GUJ93_ZPchr0005g15991 [Zizania palustris]|uniref:3'-5' exonuclease domain-containing protein n=1 Tax=Zizania palustris TaxID=103762 RepID=A0A8J5SMY1_ZIZPA|nr:hypothetical protein GUJ93_ZPchr0005g15991 [Zizania palustris]
MDSSSRSRSHPMHDGGATPHARRRRCHGPMHGGATPNARRRGCHGPMHGGATPNARRRGRHGPMHDGGTTVGDTGGFPSSPTQAQYDTESDIANAEPKPLWDEWPPTDEPTTVESKSLWDEWSPTDEPTTSERTWPPRTSNHDVVFYQYNTTIKTTITVDTVVVEQFLQDIKGNRPPCPMVVGLDTEWRKIGTKAFKLTLLQLCIGPRCLVF